MNTAIAAGRSFALVAPGDAMWGPYQTGFTLGMAHALEAQGYGPQPFDLTVGSSSGSFVATIGAAGTRMSHDFAHDEWVQYGRAVNLRHEVPARLLKRQNPLPHAEALQEIFDKGLIDTKAAFESRTTMVVAASLFQADRAREAIGSAGALVKQSIRQFLNREPASVCEHISDLVALGGEIFTPRYFTNKEWHASKPAHGSNAWHQIECPKLWDRAIQASSRIPLLYGRAVELGGEFLIDGVFADNAPLELALMSGATDVFVVGSSRSGNVFPRPVQSLTARQVRKSLAPISRISRRFSSVREQIPTPRPTDISELQARYPGQRIHVITPKGAPSVSRFFESNGETLSEIYKLGRRQAERLARNLAEESIPQALAAE